MVNQNYEWIKKQAEEFASHTFKKPSNSWLGAYGSEIIRLTAKK